MTKNNQKNNPRYANVRDWDILDLVSGLAPEMSREKARKRLDRIARTFTVSSETKKLNEPDTLILWIMSYAVSDEDRSRGIVGHHGKLTIVEQPSGRCRLSLTKYPGLNHPWTRYTMRGNANLGHPVLRKLFKGRRPVFGREEGAYRELAQLAEQYPDTARRITEDKLVLNVYLSGGKAKDRMVSYMLRVEKCEGGFTIRYSRNIRDELRRVDEVYPSGRSVAALFLGIDVPAEQISS